MNAVTTPTQHHPFNEAQWLRILFLIADTEQWLQQLHKDIFYQLPLKQHKKLLRNNWYLSASTLAHILERHYAPMTRHPGAGKFTIGVERVVAIIKEALPPPCSRCRKAAITKEFGMQAALLVMMWQGVLRRLLPLLLTPRGALLRHFRVLLLVVCLMVQAHLDVWSGRTMAWIANAFWKVFAVVTIVTAIHHIPALDY